MKKRYVTVIIAAVIVLLVGVGSTLAWLIAKTPTLTNTFTLGNVEITLTETTGSTYKMVPGATLDKDPIVTVKAQSDACWLFVKVEKTTGFDDLCSYETAEGWIPLPGEDGVFYREVEATNNDISFGILKNNTVTVKDTVTEQQLEAINSNPQLTFCAYAVQREQIDDVQTAWDCF